MNTLLKLIAVLMIPLVLAGCENGNTYPVSGEECAPGDPVQDMDAAEMDCVPPAG